jgi:hypothetical protein
LQILIRLYTGDSGAKTEQKIHAAIGSIVASRLKNRAKCHDPTAPAFGLCVGKNQNITCDTRTPIADLTLQLRHVRIALQRRLKSDIAPCQLVSP